LNVDDDLGLAQLVFELLIPTAQLFVLGRQNCASLWDRASSKTPRARHPPAHSAAIERRCAFFVSSGFNRTTRVVIETSPKELLKL
jgi:hypothetical protein